MNLPLPQARRPETWADATWPLGPVLDAASNSATFAVHAPAATRVQLEFYAGPTGAATATFVTAKGVDGVWRASISTIGPGAHYGYRVWGPTWVYDRAWTPGGSGAGFVSDVDDAGNRFNPNKLLFDPYAREISHNLMSPLVETDGGDAGMFGTGGDDYRGRPRREFDTARWAPKGILISDATPTGTRPRRSAQDTAIYEAHVKTLTMHPSASSLGSILADLPGYADVVDVPDALRGTYAGAGFLAPYLKALGFTTIELLPVHETNSSDAAVARGEANHWGYQTLSFFAPNRDYAHDRSPGGPTREFRAMVGAFHDAGIEVYLDVVFNHTAEGGHWAGDRDTVGFTSLGGFSTPDYYVQTLDHRLIDGATGCSNQTNMSSDASRNLVTDSLIHWADAMGVDGFRFDLAPVLGRQPGDAPREDWGRQRRFFDDHPLLISIRELAAARDIEVIAEAWDLWGYEVGNFPAGWGEWNGRYRDAVRGFLKGAGNTMAFIDQVNGDYLAFNDQGGPQRSINFVTAHDGFTMMDLVSYNARNNSEPFPFGPSDGGADNNISWDSGGRPGPASAAAPQLL
ncbi:MAG TPA: alpha-amylase family glycosyl hydrolase, partial [Propionibacteriaceae bacterium]|nr:alpha-amylase family glycosyl hydrolase [Propionibacteriaceae bacterium]